MIVIWIAVAIGVLLGVMVTYYYVRRSMNQDLQKERRKSLHIKENKFGTALDHTDAKKELNENGSSVLFGGDESFPESTKFSRETRSVEEDEEVTKNRTSST